jgi:hypothetical protein
MSGLVNAALASLQDWTTQGYNAVHKVLRGLEADIELHVSKNKELQREKRTLEKELAELGRENVALVSDEECAQRLGSLWFDCDRDSGFCGGQPVLRLLVQHYDTVHTGGSDKLTRLIDEDGGFLQPKSYAEAYRSGLIHSTHIWNPRKQMQRRGLKLMCPKCAADPGRKGREMTTDERYAGIKPVHFSGGIIGVFCTTNYRCRAKGCGKATAGDAAILLDALPADMVCRADHGRPLDHDVGRRHRAASLCSRRERPVQAPPQRLKRMDAPDFFDVCLDVLPDFLMCATVLRVALRSACCDAL